MTDDDVTVPIPSTTLHTLLCDHDRLESIAMLAISHADARLHDIRRLARLVRLVVHADLNDAQRTNLVAIGRILARAESRARADAALVASALRVENRQGRPFPFPTRDSFEQAARD